MAVIRAAELPRDLQHIERLWLAHLRWADDGLHERYGFRIPVRDYADQDLATIDRFAAPEGRLLLAFQNDAAVASGCLHRIGIDTGELKRMYVDPMHRRGGLGRTLLDALVSAAREVGYRKLRLESPCFMTAAHALYRSSGFVDGAPYPECGIPDALHTRWVFMERTL